MQVTDAHLRRIAQMDSAQLDTLGPPAQGPMLELRAIADDAAAAAGVAAASSGASPDDAPKKSGTGLNPYLMFRNPRLRDLRAAQDRPLTKDEMDQFEDETKLAFARLDEESQNAFDVLHKRSVRRRKQGLPSPDVTPAVPEPYRPNWGMGEPTLPIAAKKFCQATF